MIQRSADVLVEVVRCWRLVTAVEKVVGLFQFSIVDYERYQSHHPPLAMNV